MKDVERMLADRALRDAARQVVMSDIARLKASLTERSLPGRALDRATEGTIDLLEQASDAIAGHKGWVAAVAGGLALWFARKPLMDLLDDQDTPPPTGDEQ